MFLQLDQLAQPRCVNHMSSAGHIRFVVTNDFHHDNPANDAWMETAFKQIATTENADFCFGLGDLANHGTPESLATMKRLSALAGMPFYPAIGNHDLDDQGDAGNYTAVFPDRLNYTFTQNGWQFVVIDSTDGVIWQDSSIRDKTFAWLDATLPTLDSDAPTILATHFPLAADVTFAPINTEQVLTRFDKLNLRGVFCGHYHANTVRHRDPYEIVTCAGLGCVRANHDGTKGKGYLVCDGSADGEITRTFVPFAGSA
jgi:3',5'-cyclic AMP phosphodiesterase CpdA